MNVFFGIYSGGVIWRFLLGIEVGPRFVGPCSDVAYGSNTLENDSMLLPLGEYERWK